MTTDAEPWIRTHVESASEMQLVHERPWGTVWRLRDAYLEPWGRPSELRETFELAQHLGPFAHVFKELRVLDATPEEDRPRLAAGIVALLAGCAAASY